jgi:hypothetical protein
MAPIVLIPDSFAAVEPGRVRVRGLLAVACTPMATEPHVPWSDRVAFGAPKKCNPPAVAPILWASPHEQSETDGGLGALNRRNYMHMHA